MIQDATFVSVWDDCTEIHSKCFVDTETHEVFDVELIDVDSMDIDICTDEYVMMLDGTKHNILPSDDYITVFYED